MNRLGRSPGWKVHTAAVRHDLPLRLVISVLLTCVCKLFISHTAGTVYTYKFTDKGVRTKEKILPFRSLLLRLGRRRSGSCHTMMGDGFREEAETG